jgi:hypothetical protein
VIDLTGENLVTYLLREIRDTVNRNPRFRNLGGDVTIQTSNMVGWGDLRVTINGISAQGTRLSPDYFLCTQHGRAILAQLENKDGLFIEWVKELRDGVISGLPEAGVYYLNVDSVDEGTREVGLTLQSYKWREGISSYSEGSAIFFADSIDVDTVHPVDSSITYEVRDRVMYITSYTTQVPLLLVSGAGPLTPNIDFWYKRPQSFVLTQATTGGYEDFIIPTFPYDRISIVDQDNYELREGIDFVFEDNGARIRLGTWTPIGSTLTVSVFAKTDPTGISAVHPENKLPMDAVSPNNEMEPGQTKIKVSSGTNYTESDLTIDTDGFVWLNHLLLPNEKYVWEARINAGQTTQTAKKMAVNYGVINGLALGIGDMVFVGDQIAILISPSPTETYEVYGSKESISFTIEVKANDRLTASEVANMIRTKLLINSRTEMESDGLTVLEVSKEATYGSRDGSGTAPTTTYSLGVSALADWEVFIPMLTRIGSFSIDVDDVEVDFPGKPLPRISVLGVRQFIPFYA